MNKLKVYENGIYRDMTEVELSQLEINNQRIKLEETTRPLTLEEIQTMVIRQQVNNIDIPDKISSRMVDYYPTLSGDGSLIKAGTKINHNGILHKATNDLWDTETNTPDAAPLLWEKISYRDGIRIAPDVFTSTNAAEKDEYMWFGDSVYKSLMSGNVYTPEQAPSVWEEVR